MGFHMITVIYGSMASGKTNTAFALGSALKETVFEVFSQEELERTAIEKEAGIFVCNRFYPETVFLVTRPVYVIHCEKQK
jgi:hypothetical protein